MDANVEAKAEANSDQNDDRPQKLNFFNSSNIHIFINSWTCSQTINTTS